VLLRAKIAARPHRYVAQEWVHVSKAPVLERGPPETLAARTVGLRVFAVATPDGWHVMPGGLTRIAVDGDSRDIAMQRGGRSKDTWVLSDTPINSAFTLLSSTVDAEALASSNATLPSRTAENLFWFGRYGERCDAAARLLRVALNHMLEETGKASDDALPALVLARRLGLIDSIRDDPTYQLRRAAVHPQRALAERLRQLARVAFSLRDRMSNDNWRTLNRLTTDPVFSRRPSMPLTLAWLDRAVTGFMALSGFVLDGMTRGIGWRFVSIGRRIERLSTLCSVLQVAMVEGRAHELDWLLDLADSSVTYRSRYVVEPEWLPVLDLLVRDEANPRSVAFQVKGLADFVARLETTQGPFATAIVAPAGAALEALTASDLHPESEALADAVERLQRAAHAVSDAVSLRFFSHSVPRSVLSLAA
jgi:uncharacterized alpha-E superfamily protein